VDPLGQAGKGSFTAFFGGPSPPTRPFFLTNFAPLSFFLSGTLYVQILKVQLFFRPTPELLSSPPPCPFFPERSDSFGSFSSSLLSHLLKFLPLRSTFLNLKVCPPNPFLLKLVVKRPFFRFQPTDRELASPVVFFLPSPLTLPEFPAFPSFLGFPYTAVMDDFLTTVSTDPLLPFPSPSNLPFPRAQRISNFTAASCGLNTPCPLPPFSIFYPPLNCFAFLSPFFI